MALKRQQAAEDAVALSLRACVDDDGSRQQLLQSGPLWPAPSSITSRPPPDNIDVAHPLQFHDETSRTDGIHTHTHWFKLTFAYVFCFIFYSLDHLFLSL